MSTVSPLLAVLVVPQRPQVAVVEAHHLMVFACQVKRGTRDDVVNVPPKHSVVTPGHVFCELRL